MGVKDLETSLKFYRDGMGWRPSGASQAEKAGAQIIKKAQKVFWGGYSGYFADPDGYLWEVAWNPFLDFDKKDALIFP